MSSYADALPRERSTATVMDFNFTRKHATEDDVVRPATGICVSILNIPLSLLNLTAGE